MNKNTSIFTKAVHAGVDTKAHFGAISAPVYNASVFAFDDADEGAAVHNFEKPGYFYGRLGNPTQSALENTVAELEKAEDALALASGMAAISSTVMANVRAGDHIIALTSMYSTSASLFSFLADRFGIAVSLVSGQNADSYEEAIQDNTRLIWIETPSNPRLNITDVRSVAKLARSRGIMTVADNTFATPFNQNPLELSVDMVIHSATKYLGGHSDLTAGVICGNSEAVRRIRHSTNKYFGGNIAPQTAWLVSRGIKTLALRMKQHNKNAQAVADMLASHAKVREVFYPGLKNHANHEIARRQMKGFGGMVSFDLGSFDAGKDFMNGLRMIAIATSLGGVESIAQHSASMTHASLSSEEREAAGISDGLIRLSVGIEAIEDVEQDILSALEKT